MQLIQSNFIKMSNQLFICTALLFDIICLTDYVVGLHILNEWPREDIVT